MPDRINRRDSIRYKNTDRNGILNKLKENGILDRNDSWQYPNDYSLMWLGISNQRE